MGSIDKACISGFLCRLCSEMHRIVIHIYGDEGKRLGLIEKINGYLPITISPTDPLPKTICHSCLRRVEQHYDLLLRLSRVKEGRFLRVYKPNNSMCGNAASAHDEYLTEDDIRRNNPNGPFIIASTSLRAAANVSRSSPTTLASRVHEIAQSTARDAVETEEDEAEEEDEDDEEEDDDDDDEGEEDEGDEEEEAEEEAEDEDEEHDMDDEELDIDEYEENADDDVDAEHNFTEDNVGIEDDALDLLANNFDEAVGGYASIAYNDANAEEQEEHHEGDVIEDGIVDMEVIFD